MPRRGRHCKPKEMGEGAKWGHSRWCQHQNQKGGGWGKGDEEGRSRKERRRDAAGREQRERPALAGCAWSIAYGRGFASSGGGTPPLLARAPWGDSPLNHIRGEGGAIQSADTPAFRLPRSCSEITRTVRGIFVGKRSGGAIFQAGTRWGGGLIFQAGARNLSRRGISYRISLLPVFFLCIS
jgi:hypothetical protein